MSVARPPPFDEFLFELAADPRAESRVGLFSALGHDRRLVPPASIRWDIPVEVIQRLLQLGLVDAVPKVRERALALAYGLGRVRELGSRVVELTADPDEDVRCYALIALGVLDDRVSHGILVDRLQHGTVPEATAAIWALARRPDGLPDVLALLAPNPRAWVTNEALGAIQHVSAPLTDEQVAMLRRTVVDPALPRVLEHHLWRTRDPHGAEVGPDGQVEYRLTPDNVPDKAKAVFAVYDARWLGVEPSAPVGERRWLLRGLAHVDVRVGEVLTFAGRQVVIEAITTYGRRTDLLSAAMTGDLIVRPVSAEIQLCLTR